MNVSPGADRNVVDDLEVKELHVSPLDKNGSANTEQVWRAPKENIHPFLTQTSRTIYPLTKSGERNEANLAPIIHKAKLSNRQSGRLSNRNLGMRSTGPGEKAFFLLHVAISTVTRAQYPVQSFVQYC